MKIGFEAQLLLDHRKTGVGCCADNLVRALSDMDEFDYQLQYFAKGISSERLEQMQEYQKNRVNLKPCGWCRSVWYKVIWPFIPVPYWCFFGKECDLTQFFNFFIPPGVKGKKVTIVHDMAYMACPETVKLKTRVWLRLILKRSCKRADIIVAVSEFSKHEIIRYLRVPESKIRVMYPGVNMELFNQNQSEEKLDAVRAKYHIKKRYFLYLGTIEPRKNIQHIIEAYGKLYEKEADVPQLVLAGGRGWLCDGIYEAAENLGLGENILFTGYIDEDEAPVLLWGAEIFLFPSLYEGFGIPPIEAMACGTPVLSANRASLPEVLGDAALLVNPESVDDICAGMEHLMKDKDLRDKLSEKGLQQSEKYTWKRAALTLKAIYEELLDINKE